jgi:gliding motility-associated-like protein
MKQLAIILFVFLSFISLSQPANDLCSGAVNLGTLGQPANCGSNVQTGTTTTINTTNIGATPESPYVTLTGCGMSSPANSVWYRFVAPTNGFGVNISVTNGGSAMSTPNIALWQGSNCNSLIGVRCIVGSGGSATLTVGSGIVPGQTYYIQVSGGTGQSGTFTLSANAFQDCNDCLRQGTLTVSPLPVNGTYQPGQVVTFCYKINRWVQVQNNWLHGVQLAFGPGWDLTTLTTSPPPTYLSVAANYGGGSPTTCGSWGYYPNGITSSNNNTSWPAGFYFNGNYTTNIFGNITGCSSSTDGNPGNNFGDGYSCSGCVITPPSNQWNFCWTVQVSNNCTPNMSLSMIVNTSGDGESGSWTNPGCSSDASASFSAAIACCPSIMTSTNVTCFGGTNGTATATPVAGSSGPFTYSWTGPSGYTNTQSNVSGAHTISGLAAGTYTVTVTDANNCSQTATVTVTQPLATTVAATNSTICQGGSASLTASCTGNCTGISYNWSPSTGLSSTTGATVTASPTVTTTYTVSGTTSAGCSGTTTTTVTVNPVATVNAGPDQAVCAGGSATLAGSFGGSATSATWSAPSGTFSSTTNMSATYTPSITSGTVTLTLTTNDPAGPCLAVSDQIVITVNPLPTITGTLNVCAGLTTQLTGSATVAASNPWVSSNTGVATVNSSGLVTGESAGTSTITYTNSNGCQRTAIVTVNPLPIVNAGADFAVCAGTAVTLAALGAETYVWDNGVTQGVAFTPSGTNTYIVSGTDANGCVNTDEIEVMVNPLPVVSVPDASVCVGGSVTLTASGASTYTWTPATYLNTTTGASVVSTPPSNITYTVTGTDVNGCTASDAVTVTVSGNAPINAGSDVAICLGQSTTLNATGGDTYNWDSGLGAGASHTVSPTATTTYTVIGTDANGCVGTDAVVVTVNLLPTTNAGSDQTVCQGTQVTLTATGAETYSWDNGVTNGVAFTPGVGMVTYTVTGTTAAGCSTTDQVMVTVNPLPTTDAGQDQTVCAGTSVTLTASGADSYSWSNGVNQSVPFTPISTVVYEVTGTTVAGCTATDQVTVTVNPLPLTNAGADQTVCSGTSVTLTATGADTYSWDNGVTNGIAFTPAVGTVTYSVTGASTEGCTNTDQVVVTVNPNPSPVIQGPTEYCAGFSATLSTSVPYTTYDWSTGATSATINATVANNPISVTVTNEFDCQATSATFTVTENSVITANFTETICQGGSVLIHGVLQSVAGTYSQTFTTLSGCDSTSNVTLIVNPLPNVNAGDNQIVCTGTSTVLNASGAINYAWNNGVTQGVPFTQAIGSTTYSVIGTDINGCVNSDEVIVTVNPLPIVNAGADQIVCFGTVVTLSGSGASTYAWNNGVSNGVSFTPTLTNTYTVVGTDINGCVNTNQVVVTVNALPNVNAGSDITVCEGASVTLSGLGAQTYTWNNGVTNGASFVQPVGTQTYTVVGTDANDCVNSDQVIVTVNALPNVNAGSDQTLCLGGSITLTGSGASIYSWNNGVTNGVPFTPSAGSMTYTVTGTNANGCINTDQVVVTVNPLPNVNAGTDQVVCEGESVTLTAIGATTYSWNNAVVNGLSFIPPVGTTTYTVSGTDNNGCVNTDQVIVIVNPIPNVFAGNDISVCDGESVVLTGSGAATYSWNNGVVNGSPFVPTLGTTTFTVVGTSNAGCINSDQVNVTVNPNPLVSFVPGATNGCTPFTTTLTNTTADVSNCVWTISNGTVLTGCGTVPVTFTQGGCYDVSLTTTSANGCSSTFTANNLICVEDNPDAAFSPSSNQLSTLNTEVFFQNNTTGANQYAWTFGVSDFVSTETNPTYTYPNNGEGQYVVTLVATSPLGCTDTATTIIQVYEELIFYVPNTFTPDNDKYNPVFLPIFTSGFDPFDYNLLIFNRWGEVIFESNNHEVGWDGSYGKNGEIEMVQDGVYTWKIEFKVTRWDERRRAIGHVNLIR